LKDESSRKIWVLVGEEMKIDAKQEKSNGLSQVLSSPLTPHCPTCCKYWILGYSGHPKEALTNYHSPSSYLVQIGSLSIFHGNDEVQSGTSLHVASCKCLTVKARDSNN
jgi:hypothetical protein